MKITGSLIVISISFGGDSLKWEWGGISSIITSWFLSPVAAGVVAAILYTITKYSVLRRADSFKWGLRLVPAYFFFTAAINAFYIIYKGAPGTNAAKLSVGTIVGISFGIGAVFAFFSWFFFVPWVTRRVKGHEDLRWYHVFIIPLVSKRPTLQQTDTEMHAPTAAATLSPPSSSPDNTIDEKIKSKEDQADSLELSQQDTDAGLNEISAPPQSKFSQYKTKAINAAMHGLRQDVRNLDSEHLKNVHAAATLYDDDAEYLFSFLQILTACMASFAHGSNDVANAVGPLASIFNLWETATVDVAGKVPVPIWILAYGGVAIDLGLLTLGYRVSKLILIHHIVSLTFSLLLLGHAKDG